MTTGRSQRQHGLLVVRLVVAGVLLVGGDGYGQRQESAPQALEGVGIDERLGQQLPLELEFRDSRGRGVRLRDIFEGERPVVLSLTYSDCPMLCHLQLEGFVRSLQRMEWTPGGEFEIVNVSIDPNEGFERAQVTKRKHVEAYGRMETAAGWHFLTGTEEHIRRLAQAVGFRYKFVPSRNEYAHAACLIVCTPDGQVSRYLYGVAYPTQTLRLALVEAGQGKIGSVLDQVLLFCFHYDATQGRYAPVAFRIMQLGGFLTLIALLTGLVPFWLRRDRRARDRGSEPPALETKREPLAAKGA